MTATFFGHRDTPQNIAELLGAKIEELIVSRGVDEFYVGDSGAFDRMVLAELRKLEKKYPFIRYCVVWRICPPKKSGQTRRLCTPRDLRKFRRGSR